MPPAATVMDKAANKDVIHNFFFIFFSLNIMFAISKRVVERTNTSPTSLDNVMFLPLDTTDGKVAHQFFVQCDEDD